MLIEKIEQLRKEPKAVRNRVAFGVALSCSLVILVFWGLSLPSRFSFEQAPVTATEDTGPSFADQLIEIRDVVGASIEDIKSQAELMGAATTTSTTTPGAATDATSTAALIELIKVRE